MRRAPPGWRKWEDSKRGPIDSRKGRAMGRAKARKREKKTTETVSWKGGRTGFAPPLSAIITNNIAPVTEW